MTNLTPDSTVLGSSPILPDGTSAPKKTTGGESRGRTVINDAVVAKIAGLALRDVAGLHALGGGAARALGAIRDALKSTDHTQGVSVEVGEGQVAIDVTLVAAYPVPLQQVAEDARTAIIEAIESLVGLHVTEVNVTIADVHLPEETDEADEADAL
ncbi:Asp23/Gls24 family envelope stress response protein [Cryobacterium sp. PAMC25264]|uniref:Asp23/Gls24 family envelope stress response protein n=1 Tax=Cryobacterium sp. PAMC25264 TaxID=2861288 RepID=UPI001C6250F4|nr:Asp23/Gls24 family envelope stress response protein [Cryobacterium sp. PAMC25264]QYF73258.1 Asp23/Gls24 family envelope stress response protein [Cryobacterium sp. PAMC25264]